MRKRTNRIYKKGGPHRDFRKFIIIAEGEREDDYFSFFNNVNSRIQIILAPRDGGRSAVKYLIERATKYIDREGLEKEDFLWFVLDIDRWPRTEIENLQHYCAKESNWNIAIINPSFEVWLYFHFGDATILDVKTARQLKTALGKLIPGGYKKEVFAEEIERATSNSSKADKHPTHHFPEHLTTKVYQLSSEMLKILGKNWKDNL